jgi:uncharacterized protein YjbI with pentapeptide repeats
LSGIKRGQCVANEEHLTRIKEDVEAWNAWRREEGDPRKPDLEKAHLERANLLGANLSHANLLFANLSHALLVGANLSHAKLLRANLTHANLEDANLFDADLPRARLRRANPTQYWAFSKLEGLQLLQGELQTVDALSSPELAYKRHYEPCRDRKDQRDI